MRCHGPLEWAQEVLMMLSVATVSGAHISIPPLTSTTMGWRTMVVVAINKAVETRVPRSGALITT